MTMAMMLSQAAAAWLRVCIVVHAAEPEVLMLTAEIRSELAKAGLDCTEMIEKFMDSEEMFLKYFMKFFSAADSVVEELSEAIEADDHAAIENRAHALKGLSGNIGLNGVFIPARKIVDDIRAGRYDSYKDDLAQLKSAYAIAYSVSQKMA